jgi:hypothetical protein
MNLRNSWLRRTAKALVPAWLRPSNVLVRAVVRRTGHVVASGPFCGMKYVASGIESAYTPKLLGVYERELHSVIEAIGRLDADRIIDVGAAEGYYAVGLATRNPRASVVAFEQEAAGRALVAELAARNGVSDRVRILGRCEPPDLRAALAGARRPVVVCDVECFEATLLDPAAVPELASAWVLAELHEFILDGVVDLVRGRFRATHAVTEIRQITRTRSDCLCLPWYARLLPEAYAVYTVDEFRPAPMSWLWMEPLTVDSSGGPVR